LIICTEEVGLFSHLVIEPTAATES